MSPAKCFTATLALLVGTVFLYIFLKTTCSEAPATSIRAALLKFHSHRSQHSYDVDEHHRTSGFSKKFSASEKEANKSSRGATFTMKKNKPVNNTTGLSWVKSNSLRKPYPDEQTGKR
jgi:hypothetical protein